MVHPVRLVRNGHSLTVAMPPRLLTEVGWHRGDTLLAALDGDRVVLRRVAEADLMGAPPPKAVPPARRRRSA